MFMIFPPFPVVAIALPMRAASRAGARRFTAMTASHFSTSVSTTGWGNDIPALLTRTSRPPSAGAGQLLHRVGFSEISDHDRGPRAVPLAQCLGDRLEPVNVAATQHDA